MHSPSYYVNWRLSIGIFASTLAAVVLLFIQVAPAAASDPSAAPAITPQQANPTNVSTPSFLLSGDPGNTFACRLDDAENYEDCSSPLMLAPLAEGHHTLRVLQVDGAGDPSVEAAVYGFTVDLTAPDSPLVSLFTPLDAVYPVADAGSVTTENSALATFSSIDPDDVTFQCSLDGAPEVDCESPYTDGLSGLSDGLHTLVVTQTDEAGNVSDPSALSWTVDTVAPGDATWDDPFGSWTSATTFRGTDSESLSWVLPFDSGSAIRALCSIDDGPDEACDSDTTHDLSGLQDGVHSLRVKVVDEAGNASAGITTSLTTDTSKPESPTVTVNRSDFTSLTDARLTFSGEPGATFTCRLNGDGPSPCSSPVDLADLKDGQQTFEVTQIDQAGNESEAASVTWEVDTIAPAAVFDLRSNRTGITNQRNAHLTWTDTEPDLSPYCRLTRNGEPGLWNPCSSPKDVSDRPVGDNLFEVKLRDRAGNESTVAQATWKVAPLAVVRPPSIDANSTSDLPTGRLVSAVAPQFSGSADIASDVTAWQRCANSLISSCETIEGSTGSPGPASYAPGAADIGKRLRYRVIRTIDDGSSVLTASTMTGVVVPVISAPTSINGLTSAFDGVDPLTRVPALATTLRGVKAIWTTGLGGFRVQYRWQRCGANEATCETIVSAKWSTTKWADQTTYVPRSRDIGHRLRLLTGVYLGSGRYVWSPSTLTKPVRVVAENTVAPSLVFSSGLVPKSGKSVSVRPGTWRYTFRGGYRYTWRSCSGSPLVCASIPGANQSSYVPGSSTVGKRLKVKVTYRGFDRTEVTAYTAVSGVTLG